LIAYRNGELDALRVSVRAGASTERRGAERGWQRGGECASTSASTRPERRSTRRRCGAPLAQALDRVSVREDGGEEGRRDATQFVPPGQPGHYADLMTLKFDAAAAGAVGRRASRRIN
jgi:hypothetical protein